MPAIAAPRVNAATRRRRTGTPIAGMRARFSRMPRSDSPKGERTSRRRNRNISEQHHEAVHVRGAPAQVEGKEPEELPHRDAGEPVHAAGDEGGAVGRLEEQQPQAQRHHEPREVLAAHDDEAHGEPASAAAAAAASKPVTGSPQPWTASSPAV